MWRIRLSVGASSVPDWGQTRKPLLQELPRPEHDLPPGRDVHPFSRPGIPGVGSWFRHPDLPGPEVADLYIVPFNDALAQGSKERTDALDCEAVPHVCLFHQDSDKIAFRDGRQGLSL